MRLPGILFSYMSGLLLAPYLLPPLQLPLLIAVAAAAMLLSRSSRLTASCLFLVFFCIGLFQYTISIAPPGQSSAIHRLNEQGPVVVEGVVNAVTMRYPQGATCRIAVNASLAGNTRTVRTGNIQLTIDQLDTRLTVGDTVRFRTRLRSPRLFGTPGEFDYPRHLARNSIFATGFLPRGSDIVRLRSAPRYAAVSALSRWRQNIADIIDASIPPAEAAYVKGLALGDRGALSPEQRQLLARSGIAHLFAISGLHLGIIASFLYVALRSLYRRMPCLLRRAPPARILPAAILPLIVAYMLFTGGALSTLRALLVLVAVTIAVSLRRQVAPLHLLMTTALIMLLFDPLALFTPAFQLSFAGATGILLTMPRWIIVSETWPRPLAYPATLLVVTVSATLATLPLVLLNFHILAPAGMVLNLLAVPAVTLLAVPLCLAGLIAALLSPQLATILFGLAGAVLDIIINAAQGLLTLPGLSGVYLYLPFCSLLAVGILTSSLLIPASRKLKLASLTVALLLLSFSHFSDLRSDQLRIAVFSVGQGDAALVITPAGHSILVDGGGFTQSSFDTGERLVAPALGYLGVRELDAVVLSHNHPDHRNGLLHILKHFTVRSFWSPTATERLPAELQSILVEQHIPVRTFAQGWSVVEQTETTKLAAYRVPDAPQSANDRSLVLYFQNHDEGLLLPGDLEATGIRRLASAPPPGPVTLLKVPHHGSLHSAPLPLLEQFTPRSAYISAGLNNRYGHPHSTVLKQLAQHNLQPDRTDLRGSLFFSTDGAPWQTKHWKNGLFR